MNSPYRDKYNKNKSKTWENSRMWCVLWQLCVILRYNLSQLRHIVCNFITIIYLFCTVYIFHNLFSSCQVRSSELFKKPVSKAYDVTLFSNIRGISDSCNNYSYSKNNIKLTNSKFGRISPFHWLRGVINQHILGLVVFKDLFTTEHNLQYYLFI